MKYLQIFKAFTIAEILIVLGIIGIVANLTLPTILNDAQEASFKNSWKKNYSAFANATASIINDNGGSFQSLITNEDESLRILYEPYLNVIEKCPGGSSLDKKCWHAQSNWKLFNNSAISDSMAGEANFTSTTLAGDTLADGTFVRYTSYGNCNGPVYTGNCGYILIDVNGNKRPNTVGKDIYAIHLSTTKAFPFGTNDPNASTCTSASHGFGCSAQYLNN